MQDQCVVCPCKDHDWKENDSCELRRKFSSAGAGSNFWSLTPSALYFFTYLKTVKLWGNVSS